MDITGKLVVVTGASSGIGRDVALDLADRGARVCAAARREDRLRALVDEMGGSGRGHSYLRTDVADRSQVRRLAAHVGDTYGRCDILVNNAGISRAVSFDGPQAADVVEEVVRTNFFGAVWCTAELMDLLVRSAPSHVVNVASVAGRLAAGSPAYVASKFALVGWSEALHPRLAVRGVYVSSVEPGIIPTEGFPATAIGSRRLLRKTMGTTQQVSKAILDAIDGRKVQRVVPRWYYLLQVPRLLTPGLYRFVQRKVVAPIYERDQTKARSSGDPSA